MYQRAAMLVTLHCDNSQFLYDGGFHKGAAIWLALGPPSSDGFGLRRLCWLFVSLRTGHRADFWLNPPHCDEWGVGGGLVLHFAAEALPSAKYFSFASSKKRSNFDIRRAKTSDGRSSNESASPPSAEKLDPETRDHFLKRSVVPASVRWKQRISLLWCWTSYEAWTLGLTLTPGPHG